jgi:L-rhamnose mutarotase
MNMKTTKARLIAATLAPLAILVAGCDSQKPGAGNASEPETVTKRVGMVVGLNPVDMAEYKRLHADDNAGVRDLLNTYHMQNFSIFLHQIEGKWYEFGYYEYTGDDFDGDMAKMDEEPRIKDWLKVCDPMQVPLEGEKSWATMEQVYYNK